MRLVIPDLLPNTGYALQVRANDGANVSEWSTRFDILTTQDTVLPAAPTGASWVVSGDAFYATWNPVTTNTAGNFSYITRYEIRLTGNTVEKIISVPHQTGTNPSYTLNFETNRSLFGNPAATVDFQVRAVDNTDLKSAWTTIITATNPEPAPVTSLVATPLIDQVGLTWVAPADTDVVGYNIYASTSSGFTPTSGNKVGFASGTSFNYNTVTYVTWHFVVRSVDKFGTEGIIVRASATPQSSFTVDAEPPNAPTAVIATTGFDTTKQQAWANVSWTASSSTDVKRYEVRYSTTAGTNWQYFSVGGDITSARIENLVPNTSYYIDVRAVDFSGNVSSWVNDPGTSPTKYPILVAKDIAEPSQPAIPGAAVGTQRLQVTISGNKQGGGTMEPDVARYQVFASNTTGFTPGPTNMLGTIEAGPAMVETFQIPAASATTNATSENWFVVIKAVDRSGNVSLASPEATAAVGLILTANIGDAQITNAKINTIQASKITTGTISAQTITLGATGTMVVDSTGVIKTNNWSSGTTGWRLDSTGLEINNGSIAASALRIQDGANLMPVNYADFEGNPTSYVFLQSGGAQTLSVINTSARFNTQCLRATWGAVGSAPIAWMTPASGVYNINAEAGQVYIVSAYFWNTGSVATSVTLGVAWGNASNVSTGLSSVTGANGVNVTIPAGTTAANAIRVYGYASAPAGTTKAAVYVQGNTLTSGAGYNVDGWQFERQEGNLTTPSQWKPPSMTTIDGGIIRTGEIRSNAFALLADQTTSPTDPAWSINMAGNAVFGNANVRGSLVVGNSPTDTNSIIQSSNYVRGSAGWGIFGDGTADFLGITSPWINGQAISVGTLSPMALGSGELSDTSVIKLNGILQAEGSMGERIRMGGHGFDVIGPHEAPISTIGTDGTTVTVTTQRNHGYAIDSIIYISDVNESFDGEYTVASVPANNQFTYAKSGTAISPFSPPYGVAYGQDTQNTPENRLPQPVYVEFPSTIARPNIVSGTLQASTLTVSRGASFRGLSGIEVGAELVVASAILAPKAAPAVAVNYNQFNLVNYALGLSIFECKGICIGHNGNIFLSTYGTNNFDVPCSIIEEFTPTGTRVGKKVETFGSSSVEEEYLSLVYRNNNYYQLVHRRSGSTHTYRIDRYNTSFVLQQSRTVALYTTTLGFNHNTGRLITGLYSGSTLNTVEWGLDPTTGAIDAASQRPLSTPMTAPTSDLCAIAGGNFGASSAERYMVKAANESQFRVLNPATSTIVAGEYWFTAFNQASTAAFWNPSSGAAGEFWDFYNGTIRQYAEGDSVWNDTAAAKRQWIASSYLREISGAETETNLSPRAYLDLPKKARMSVTIASIPGGTADLPNWARVYVARQVGDPGPSGTAWKLRRSFNTSGVAEVGSIKFPGTTMKVNPYETINTPVGRPYASNQFTQGSTTAGTIRSSTGNSFWRGDDTAQFYQLVLTSSDDASTSANNKPPLRIGNIAAQHLRIDNNEIIAMASNTSQAALILNAGGQTSVTDISIGTIVGGVTGSGTLVMGSIRGTASVIDLSLDGGGTTGASVNNAGRFVRTTSSARYKDNITPMTLATAHQALDLEAVTFSLKDEIDMETRPVYPGFIAEQANEVGANLWVFKDSDGRPDGFRYAELTAAHNMLIKELYEKIDELETQISNLGA